MTTTRSVAFLVSSTAIIRDTTDSSTHIIRIKVDSSNHTSNRNTTNSSLSSSGIRIPNSGRLCPSSNIKHPRHKLLHTSTTRATLPTPSMLSIPIQPSPPSRPIIFLPLPITIPAHPVEIGVRTLHLPITTVQVARAKPVEILTQSLGVLASIYIVRTIRIRTRIRRHLHLHLRRRNDTSTGQTSSQLTRRFLFHSPSRPLPLSHK